MSRREERQTIVTVEGDEETMVPQHELYFARGQLQDLFKDPTCNVFFCLNSRIPSTLTGREKSQRNVRYQEKTGWILTRSLL